jgi:hypothetical protein
VLGLLQETLALDALAAAYRVENLHEVKSAIAWAGKRTNEAFKAGYTTLNAIFQYFHIDYEVESMEDPNERRLLAQMQHSSEMDTIHRSVNKAGNVMTGMALGAALMGSQGLVMGAMTGLTPGAEVLSSGLEPRPQLGKTRTPPTRPADTDIQIIARRLLDNASADKRRKAAIDLISINNPAALPHLAHAFVEDIDQGVRETAERAGKLIYWNAIYWQMEQDGAINAAIKRRAVAAGKIKDEQPSAQAETPPAPVEPPSPIHRIQPLPTQPAPPPAQPPKPVTSKVSLADIVRRTDEVRQKHRQGDEQG